MEMIGRIAGVSQVTVSRALSDPSKVSPATLRKIQDAIAATGFVPNALAGALASRRSRLVSTLVPSITNLTYSSMVKSFAQEMRAQGYQIMLSECGFDPAEEEAAVMTHLSRRPDAMLLVGTRHSANTRKMLLAAGIPVVEVWDITDTPIDLCFGFSHPEAGKAAARFAAGAGYARAACVGASDERALRRKEAFRAEFRALTGTEVPEARFESEASLGIGRAGLARLLDTEGFEKGVVFCSSDLVAHGVLLEAASRGLAIPGDIAVIGFGDQGFAPDTFPPLTSMRVDRGALGASAARAIFDRLDRGHSAPIVTDIGFEIIRRESA
ncbi:LacI family DNA-binding transcriptional regulator [Amaricoccus solimangrovi]|uniref:LacI family DNA-binding transcriptional regulator n=2 Tax=Amaricoccus solimangrovi TaxID=2589815 RepID=A0A501WLX6_9RHOB|nr:LacI family DNA-binding transcriptional regulator [Amaricoccus solimangrovi]